jgi:hypothetical protein
MTAANTHVPMSNGNDASLHLQSSSVPTTTSAPDVFSIPRRASLAAPSSPATTARSARCTDGTGTVEHGVDSAGPGGWWPVDSEQGRHRLPGHSPQQGRTERGGGGKVGHGPPQFSLSYISNIYLVLV